MGENDRVSDLIDTTEMYLRTIYELVEEGIVPLRARIAERLHQSGPTVSQTVGEDAIVEEMVIAFTHTTEIDWLLPGVAPTGKPIEVAVVVIVGIKDGKISHEHIYWDQAGVLVQVGLLDPAGLPVSGAESARKVVDPSLPPRPM